MLWAFLQAKFVYAIFHFSSGGTSRDLIFRLKLKVVHAQTWATAIVSATARRAGCVYPHAWRAQAVLWHQVLALTLRGSGILWFMLFLLCVHLDERRPSLL